jgi:hypothetical protein
VGTVFFDIDNVIDEINRTCGGTKDKKTGNYGENRGKCTPEVVFGKNKCAKNKSIFDPLSRAHRTNQTTDYSPERRRCLHLTLHFLTQITIIVQQPTTPAMPQRMNEQGMITERLPFCNR